MTVTAWVNGGLYALLGFVAGYALSLASLFVLRRREPDTPRPYRAWVHPWTTGLVFTGSVVFLATTPSDPVTATILAVLIVASYPLYRYISRRRG